MPESTTDPELNAMLTIMNALEPLDSEARQRVVVYVFQRLNLPLSVRTRFLPSDTGALAALPTASTVTSPPSVDTDIRTLREQKTPRSASEMAALVAYYIAELIPLDERRNTIDKDDIVKYFKQAGYPLPKAIKQTLPNAARSGYFDITGGGRYRLNPVGYNLVVHGLPAKQSKQ